MHPIYTHHVPTVHHHAPGYTTAPGRCLSVLLLPATLSGQAMGLTLAKTGYGNASIQGLSTVRFDSEYRLALNYINRSASNS